MQKAKKRENFRLQKLPCQKFFPFFFFCMIVQVHVFYEQGQEMIDFSLQTRNHQRVQFPKKICIHNL